MRGFIIYTISQTLLGPKYVALEGQDMQYPWMNCKENISQKTVNEGEPERPGCVCQDNIERDLNEIDVKI